MGSHTEIILRKSYSIICLTYVDKDLESRDIKFSVKLTGKTDIDLTFNFKDKKVMAYQRISISKGTFEILEREITDGHNINPKPKRKVLEELKALGNDCNEAVNKTLNAMNLFLHWENSKNLSGVLSLEWSVDGKDWKVCPIFMETVARFLNIVHLTENASEYIQQYLDGNGWEPFLALKYLNRAKNETEPSFKWIDTTIAAELAIKEFYIRACPQLEVLLLAIPSPPIHLLYGKIMKSFIEKESPKLKEIQNGVEKRNELVHKPKDLKITLEEATKYVEDIEYAIYHLLSILYGDKDSSINRIIKPNVQIIRKT